MDTQGPTSVLDSGTRVRDHLVRDRITRQKSPSRTVKSHTRQEEGEDIVYRIPQPYRTSFSACKSVERGKKDRSRSLSPTSSLYSDRSLLSDRSGRTNRNRSKSPKRVTYASKVIVRHSDTEDSMLADLSSQDLDQTPQSHKYPVSPIAGRANVSTLSKDSGLETSPFLDISSHLPKMDKSSSILKDTQNSRQMSPPSSPHDQQSSPTGSFPAQVGPDNKENSPTRNGGHRTKGDSPGVQRSLSKEYQHDRTISYRMAVQEQEQQQQPRQAGDRDSWDQSKLDKDGGMREERSNTMPTNPNPLPPGSGQLTPSKKSISGSIGNFFRRISPRMGRKPAKERKCHSAGGSAQSLSGADSLTPDSEGPSGAGGHSHGSNFSRNRVRESFNKFFKRPKSKSKGEPAPASSAPRDAVEAKAGVTEVEAAPAHSLNANGSANTTSQPQHFPNATNRLLKSIEQNSMSDKTVYQKFKEKQSPHRPGEVTLAPRGTAMKLNHKELSSPSWGEASSSSNTEADRSPMQVEEDMGSYEQEMVKPAPPRSLDVLPPRPVKALQSSVISTISGDESIGECSLDINLTASEPSLLSGTSHTSQSSKQAVISQDLAQSQSDSSSGPSPRPQQTSHPLPGSREHALSPQAGSGSDLPPYSPSPLSDVSGGLLSPQDPARKPSYLKIACAVSGYGRYSQYTSYRDIERRSPFSSTSSLQRSGLSTPDMPAVRSPGTEAIRAAAALANGQCGLPLLNGHAQATYPTGDTVKDGEYFLQLTQMEEDRLQLACTKAEAEAAAGDLPEEACGKIRAAIGKSNLLITQKFQQFRDLCSQHMHPESSEKLTKWEDLQGFWDMCKLQVDSVDEMFAEIEAMRQNGWREILRTPTAPSSRRSSASSSPKSGSQSQASTPSATPGHTPGSKRKTYKPKDTPESSPEHEKARQVAKARDEARKKMLAEKRAALKQQNQQAAQDVEIFLPEGGKT